MSEPVVSGRKLSRYQRERLAEAEGLASGNLSDRRRAALIIRDIERELSEARTSEAVEAAIDDTLSRAKARGEEFEVETVDVGEWRRNDDGSMARRHGQIVLDVQTVRRASRVDGLANLYKSGSITDEAKRWGDTYRVLWEQAMPPVSISGLSASGGGGRDPGRMLERVALAGRASAVVTEIGRRIGDQRTLDVLNAVVGQGRTLRSLGNGGDLNHANKQRLVDALAVVETVLQESTWKGLAKQER
ncbi:MAG: hypothetical protein SWI22_02265 [Pseudomonadota bacterium]|nr:hypothetical protein [Pseudomonadota bacterium]